jgi:hypothetical protein
MPEPDTDKRWNRDEDRKPGRPDRMAQEPPGAEGSARSDKTATDPASGEPRPGAPAPNRSQSDEKDGRR